MSASALREGVRKDIQDLIAQERTFLSDRDDPADVQLRRQGVIRGLDMALMQLNNRYKDLNG